MIYKVLAEIEIEATDPEDAEDALLNSPIDGYINVMKVEEAV